MSKKQFIVNDWVAAMPPQSNTPPVQSSYMPTQGSVNSEIEEITKRVEAAAVDIAPDYATWCDLGFALADGLGESGRDYYQRLSRFYNGYTPTETDKQYDACLKSHGHGVSLKTFFHLAKQADVSVAIASQRTPSFVSPISPKGEIEELGETDEEEQEPMPTFSQSVQNNLPTLLTEVVSKAISPEDADLLLLGSLTVFSACLPNVYGIYAEREVFPSLFLFVTAQASAGKGRLTLCRHLVEPIHKEKKANYAAEMEAYRFKQAEYVADKNNPEREQPKEPPMQMLFIPANSSSTSVYQVLNDNKGEGLMFETEGDTLANTFKSDYGNFSDGFRKAFHHETISYNRRKERECVELETPRLAALLSGTPRQIFSLIKDAENGLFSRFIFYYMNVRLEWNNVFANTDSGTLDSYFRMLGSRFHELYIVLKASNKIRFALTKPQEQAFNAYFAEVQSQYVAFLGYDIVASVRRLGLITYRIAMILSTLRILDSGQISEVLVCDDADFQTAMGIVKVLIKHTAKVYETLPKPQQANTGHKTELSQNFYDSLPREFNRKDYLSVAEQLKIPPKTAEKHIERFCKAGALTHPAHGKYAKPQ